MILADSRPQLAPKARLRFDRLSGGYLLLYPERGLALNPTAASTLQLCTGEFTVEGIVIDCRSSIRTRPGERSRSRCSSSSKS